MDVLFYFKRRKKGDVMGVSISKGTVLRTVMLGVVILNMVLKKLGFVIINVTEDEITTFIEIFLELAVIAVAFWKNNSYSEKAIKADEFLKMLKESEE